MSSVNDWDGVVTAWFAPLSHRVLAVPSIAFAGTSVVLLGEADTTQPARDSAGPDTFSSRTDQLVVLVAVWLILMNRDVCGATLIVTVAAVPATFDTTVVQGPVEVLPTCS